MAKLEGKIAAVTGAGGVLGRYFVQTLLEEGASVALLDLKLEAAQEAVDAMAEMGFDKAIAVVCNVLEPESVAAAHAEVNDKLGKVDILLNAAGGNHPKATANAEEILPETPLEDTFFGLDLDAFKFVNELNFQGTLLPTKVFALDMLGREGCSIVNISSMSGFLPLTKVAAYSSAKASINNFTYWLSVHLGKMGIRVNAIAPGFFATNQNKFLLFEEDGETLTARGHKIIAGTPMGKFGVPEDLMGALRYLTSDEAGFVTGVVLPVDGGFMAYSGV